MEGGREGGIRAGVREKKETNCRCGIRRRKKEEEEKRDDIQREENGGTKAERREFG